MHPRHSGTRLTSLRPRRSLAILGLLAIALSSLPVVGPTPVRAANPTDQPGRFLGPKAVGVSPGKTSVAAASVPTTGFSDASVLSGFTNPVAIRFASDGRVFVAEKSGLIKVFDNLADTTPSTFADLRDRVHDFWDRGLLGMTLDPAFPTSPYVYVMYAMDAKIGGTPSLWGDGCPTPPGSTTDGCVIGSRLSRLTAVGNVASTTEKILVEDWCQQYPSHSAGDLRFGTDGTLYASGGEGANFLAVDYGQWGGGSGSPTLKNPCGDPPVAVGGTQVAPTARGGALRSQSLRRPSGEPVVLGGTVIRVNPATGAGPATNPLAAKSALTSAARMFELCGKLTHLEQTESACFQYHLGKDELRRICSEHSEEEVSLGKVGKC